VPAKTHRSPLRDPHHRGVRVAVALLADVEDDLAPAARARCARGWRLPSGEGACRPCCRMRA